MRAEAGVGSFNQRLASISTALNAGPWSTSFYGNAIKSDGYRENNALDQRNGVGNLNSGDDNPDVNDLGNSH